MTLGTYTHFQAAQDWAAAELMEGVIRLPRSTTSGETSERVRAALRAFPGL